MKFIILIITFYLALPVEAKSVNYGHRLGSDIIKYLPENSLEVYEVLLTTMMNNKKFKYVEFDIRQSLSGELLVFHDSTLKRMTASQASIKLDKVSFKDLRKLCLTKTQQDKCVQIPTPKEVLELSVQYNLTKPVMIEIKNITHIGKSNIIALANSYKERLNINFIISDKNFNKLFSEKWCEDFSANGYTIMQTGIKKNKDENDLCEQYYPKTLKTALLKEILSWLD